MGTKFSAKKIFSQWVVDFLSYNRTEQKGIFVLCIILFLVILANVVIPGERVYPQDDFSAFEKEVRAFETAWQKAEDSITSARLKKFRSYTNHYRIVPYDTTYAREKKVKDEVVIELNAADTFDLQRLRGIGSSFARRIVSYRKRLGGFNDKRQLLEVFGMDNARYQGLVEHVWVNEDSVHPVDLNNVLFKELLKHPYFPFEITKAIMVYRQKNKRFKTLEELKQIEGINDSIFKKIEIYLIIRP
ncbi:MAG: helix-hairpin-helix domain-containing protein [Bacteroidales bacterium]|jgi:DNA uptake protein ComE-like DNA-binding protein|nr:helix-hairpin-helix domain-containing protein [Bacteroidales bacterium]